MANRIGAGGPFLSGPLQADVRAPFIPFDDSRPKLLRTLLVLPGLWFNSAIMPEGPKPQVADESYRQPARIINRQADQAPNLALGIPPPFTAEDFSQPRRFIGQYWQGQNSTINLPVAAAASPFLPTDLEVPRKQVRLQSEQVQNRAVLDLVFPPFIPEDLEYQKRLVKSQFEQAPNLIIQAVTAQAVLPFQDLDWSFPRQPWKLVSGHHWFNSAIMPKPDDPPSGIAPFVPVELGNAKFKLRTREAAEQSRLVLETPPVTKPFVPLDWSLPKRLTWRVDQADQYPLTLVTITPDQAVTREALILHVERPAPKYFAENIPSRLVLQATFPPFFGTTTPNSPLPKLGDRGWFQNLLENTLSLAIVSPFAQYEWPIPQGVRAPEVRVAEPQGSNITEVPPGPPIPPVVVIPDTSGDGSGRHDTFPPRHRKDLTLLEREKERKKLFRKSKIKYQLPLEEQQIVEDAVQTAAITKPLADGLAPEAVKAKTTYLETLLRGLEQTEKLNAQILSSLFDLEVENRLLEFEEEEAIAILTAWWMNEA